MPTKIWVPGEEMLAADINDYLQEQVIATFANAAARDAAITSPLAGMTCYLASTGEVLVYHSGAWRKPWASPWGWVSSVAVPNYAAAAGATPVPGSGFTLPIQGRRYAIHATATVLQSNYTNITQIVTLSIQVGAAFPDFASVGGGGAGFGDTIPVHLAGVHVATVNNENGLLTINPAGITAQLSQARVWVEDVGL